MGITITVNEDGTIEIGNNKTVPRDKGKSLVEIPSNYTVIDIETTGLDPKFDEIIEIGAMKIRNGKIVDEFESLVKPDGYYFYDDNDTKYFSYIDEFITELTGITNEMLEDAPKIDEVLPDFINFISNDILVGHNIHFDINFLYDYCYEILDYKLQNDFVDLMILTRKVYPDFTNHKLDTIAENLGINNSSLHRSLADCKVTYECFSKLSQYIDDNNIDLKELFSYKAVDLTTIKPNVTDFDEDHPLYNKYCTFTGKLEKMNRKDAAQLVVNLGGHCLNNVTKKTNFLILGNFDYCSNIKGGKSSKLRKAEQLILKGQDLQILSEDVFYELVLTR